MWDFDLGPKAYSLSRSNGLAWVVSTLLLVGCSSGNQRNELREFEKRLDEFETEGFKPKVRAQKVEVVSFPQTGEPSESQGLHFRCEPDLPDAKGNGCGSSTLVEYWATRGVRVLAPANWHDSLRDGMGSGSSAEWWNPEDHEERIDVSTGISRGMWFEIDGVTGSISPDLMIPETADIYPQSRSVFAYIDSEDDLAIVGVFRITQSNDGEDCCYYKAEIRLRYHDGANAHFWNMFLDHQLRVVAGTDFRVEFQHHDLQYRFS